MRNIVKRFFFNAQRWELIVIVVLMVIHVVLIKVYRPYVYAHGTIENGLSLVGNYPSFSAVVLSYLIFEIYSRSNVRVLQVLGYQWRCVVLACIVAGNYLYEGLDLLLGGGDWWDMVAITLGGVFVLLAIVVCRLASRGNC